MKFGQLVYECGAIRLVVDTGMHAKAGRGNSDRFLFCQRQ
jgi:uncharacterized protein (DUF885 family)